MITGVTVQKGMCETGRGRHHFVFRTFVVFGFVSRPIDFFLFGRQRDALLEDFDMLVNRRSITAVLRGRRR